MSQPDAGFWERPRPLGWDLLLSPSHPLPSWPARCEREGSRRLLGRQVSVGISSRPRWLRRTAHRPGGGSLLRNLVRKDGSGLSSILARGSCSPLRAEPKGGCVFVRGAGVLSRCNACSGPTPVIYSTWIVFVRRCALKTRQVSVTHRTELPATSCRRPR